MANAFHARADLKQLVDLFLVLGYGEGHLGMIEHEGHLVGHRVLVDRDRDRADALRGHEGPVQPRAVVADDGHLLARLQTERLKTESKRPNFIVRLGPRPCLPDSQVLFADCRAILEDRRVSQKQFGKCVYVQLRSRLGPHP